MNGPAPCNVSTKPAAFTAATNVLKLPALAATPTISWAAFVSARAGTWETNAETARTVVRPRVTNDFNGFIYNFGLGWRQISIAKKTGASNCISILPPVRFSDLFLTFTVRFLSLAAASATPSTETLFHFVYCLSIVCTDIFLTGQFPRFYGSFIGISVDTHQKHKPEPNRLPNLVYTL